MAESDPAGTVAPKPFEVFRRADYRDYGEHGVLEMVGVTPAIAEGLGRFATSGGGAGQQVSLAYARPGMNLTHVWFKSGYPLPLHSHGGDCLYIIIAGSIRMGTKALLGPGDGFFVGSDVPYTYEVGPEGAEVLEFRTTNDLNIRFMAKGRGAWDKTVAKLEARQDAWAHENPPSGRSLTGVE